MPLPASFARFSVIRLAAERDFREDWVNVNSENSPAIRTVPEWEKTSTIKSCPLLLVCTIR